MDTAGSLVVEAEFQVADPGGDPGSYSRGVHWGGHGRHLWCIAGPPSGGNSILRLSPTPEGSSGLTLDAEVRAGEFVYDARASPFSDAAVAACVRGQPVQIWKAPESAAAAGGEWTRVASFREATERPGDEHAAPAYCVEWLSRERIVAGSSRALRVFDLEAESRVTRVPASPHRADEWLDGIHSALAIDRSAATPLVAVGTYHGMVALLDERASGFALAGRLADSGPQEPFLASGVTCLRFARNGQFLLVGTRQGEAICAFDVRMLDLARGCVAYFPRTCRTSQKWDFDVSPDGGAFLACGHEQGGEMLVYDLASSHIVARQVVSDANPVNACAFGNADSGDPGLIIAISSGERRADSKSASSADRDEQSSPSVATLRLTGC
jgi:hypothetical protein